MFVPEDSFAYEMHPDGSHLAVRPMSIPCSPLDEGQWFNHFCTMHGTSQKATGWGMVWLQERFVGLVDRLAELMVDPHYHLGAAVYTEVSDVEAEINGWCTYDRQVRLWHLKAVNCPHAFKDTQDCCPPPTYRGAFFA